MVWQMLRPRSHPANIFYDALGVEMDKRPGRVYPAWKEMEIQAMHRAASDYAISRSLSPVTFEQIAKAERMAMGHVDYGAKWAIHVAFFLQDNNPEVKDVVTFH